jgi:hypothetical protein
MPAIIMELCGAGKTKNTGAESQECLEGILQKPFVAKADFRFASLAAFKDLAVWKTAIANKDIVPLYDAYEVAPNNQEATDFATGNFSYRTAPAVKKTKFECYLSFCSHRALTSYQNSIYTQVFETTQDGGVLGVLLSDGKIKGQDLSNITIGIRNIATKAKVAYTDVMFTYRDYEELEQNAVVAKPTWDFTELKGIYDVYLKQVSQNATTIKLQAFGGCGNTPINSFVLANFVVKNAAGVVQVVTFTAPDATGTYTLTGTGFAAGFTVALSGVVSQTNIMYETPEVLTLV